MLGSMLLLLLFIHTPFVRYGRKCIAGKEQKTEAEVETFLLTLRVSIILIMTILMISMMMMMTMHHSLMWLDFVVSVWLV